MRCCDLFGFGKESEGEGGLEELGIEILVSG